MKGRKNMRKTRSDCRVGTFEKKQSRRNIIMEKKIRKRYHSEEADKITELYLQQQKFHERVFKTIGGVVTLVGNCETR